MTRILIFMLILGSGGAARRTSPAAADDIRPHGLEKGRIAQEHLVKLERRVAVIWGRNNVWLPSARVWVRYEDDFGERSAVDFENGVVRVQILLGGGDDPRREIVFAHLCQGVGNLILGEATDPVEMMPASVPAGIPANPPAQPPPGMEIRVYLVKEGDSLWEISRRFGMQTQTLAQLNGMDPETTLHAGRPLKVFVYRSHDLTLDEKPRPAAAEPLLLDQIRMVDGRPVPAWMVHEFAEEVVTGQPLLIQKVVGDDGVERLAVGIEFKLVSNHLEVRAKKFLPLVKAHARKNSLDPALIMAIIHTESVFNPRARSRTPAYGLMQLVPYTGAREAYGKIYGHKRKLTPHYLYDPENNIELGTTYFSILKNDYMGRIRNPDSRTFCAVAAYNAGASNVGSAFISRKSITRATPAINRLDPLEVYERLVNNLPLKESRDYIRKVYDRLGFYREWF